MKNWKRPKYLQSMKEYYATHPEEVKRIGKVANRIEKYLKGARK